MTLLERLRAETRTQHEAMEATFPLPQTKEDHARTLKVFLGFLEPLEQRISDLLQPSHVLLRGRAKTAWLKEDLRALGRTDEDIAALPRCSRLPPVDNLARSLGALYVFEGATLGGQIIARHVEEKLGLSEGAGYRYFRSYGSAVGRRWQEFRELVLHHSTPEADADCIASASDTFAKLGAWSRQTS